MSFCDLRDRSRELRFWDLCNLSITRYRGAFNPGIFNWSPGMISESKWNLLSCMPNFFVCEIFWEEILNISLGFQRGIWPQNDKELSKSFGVKYQFSVGI